MYGAATVWLGHSVEPPLSAARHSRRVVGNLENYPTGLGPSLTTEQTGNCRTIPSHQETPESARHRLVVGKPYLGITSRLPVTRAQLTRPHVRYADYPVVCDR
jgi:hypothetical protein